MLFVVIAMEGEYILPMLVMVVQVRGKSLHLFCLPGNSEVITFFQV